MQQVAIAEVTDDGAIPADVLRTLGAAAGDTIAFVRNDDGSLSLVKGARRRPKPSVGEFAGIFARGEKRSLKEDLALMREIRYGDELDGEEVP